MPEALLFVEDAAQERFLAALLKRLAAEQSMPIGIQIRSSRGGASRVLRNLAEFLREVEQGSSRLPDGMVIGIDANCRGFLHRRNEVQARAPNHGAFLILAIPDPHIERWFLLDSEAFKKAVGTGCTAPDSKCEKSRYKRLLNSAFLEAGIQPLLGGVEFAEDIANELHIQRVADTDISFGRFVSEVRSWLHRQRRTPNA